MVRVGEMSLRFWRDFSLLPIWGLVADIKGSEVIVSNSVPSLKVIALTLVIIR